MSTLLDEDRRRAAALRAEVSRAAPGDAAGLFGPAFRGITRVAASDPRVAEAYCRANLAEVRRAWESLQREVARRIEELATS